MGKDKNINTILRFLQITEHVCEYVLTATTGVVGFSLGVSLATGLNTYAVVSVLIAVFCALIAVVFIDGLRTGVFQNIVMNGRSRNEEYEVLNIKTISGKVLYGLSIVALLALYAATASTSIMGNKITSKIIQGGKPDPEKTNTQIKGLLEDKKEMIAAITQEIKQSKKDKRDEVKRLQNEKQKAVKSFPTRYKGYSKTWVKDAINSIDNPKHWIVVCNTKQKSCNSDYKAFGKKVRREYKELIEHYDKQINSAVSEKSNLVAQRENLLVGNTLEDRFASNLMRQDSLERIDYVEGVSFTKGILDRLDIICTAILLLILVFKIWYSSNMGIEIKPAKNYITLVSVSIMEHFLKSIVWVFASLYNVAESIGERIKFLSFEAAVTRIDKEEELFQYKSIEEPQDYPTLNTSNANSTTEVAFQKIKELERKLKTQEEEKRTQKERTQHANKSRANERSTQGNKDTSFKRSTQKRKCQIVVSEEGEAQYYINGIEKTRAQFLNMINTWKSRNNTEWYNDAMREARNAEKKGVIVFKRKKKV